MMEQQHLVHSSLSSFIHQSSAIRGTVVFDRSLYTCKQILQFMASVANNHLTIGIYWPERQQITTSDAIFRTE